MIGRSLLAAGMFLGVLCASVHAQQGGQSFAAFLDALWPDAQAKGITRGNFDLALKGLSPDPRVIAATKHQPEYGKPFGAYVNAIASKRRVADGKRKAKQWSR